MRVRFGECIDGPLDERSERGSVVLARLYVIFLGVKQKGAGWQRVTGQRDGRRAGKRGDARMDSTMPVEIA